MSPFQALAIVLLFALSLVAVAVVRRRRLAPAAGLAWLAVWIAAAALILRPELTAVVARWLGIARGADLVFYLGILAGLVGFFVVFLRFRRLERQLTVIAREIALLADRVEPGGIGRAGEAAAKSPADPPAAGP